MKNVVMFLINILLMMTPVSATSQNLPKGKYHAEPVFESATMGEGHYSLFTTNIRSITVVWNPQLRMMADFDINGSVTNIDFVTQHPSKDEEDRIEYYGWDKSRQSVEVKPLANLNKWKKFAEAVRQNFVVINDKMYIEKIPYIYIGDSIIIQNREIQERSLIFKDGKRLIAISDKDWRGSKPKDGEKVMIGHPIGGNTISFQVFKNDGTYCTIANMFAEVELVVSPK